jgi:hypothetical protein
MHEEVTITVTIDDDLVIEKAMDKIENDIRDELEEYVTKQIQGSGIICEGVCEVEIEMLDDED